jgi:primosomal protein N' (replication factor Y)
LFVEVIIPLPLPKNYTWFVPEQLQDQVQPGIRVEVNFGRNKRYAGIVKKTGLPKPAAFDPKEIISVLDTEPLLHPAQLTLWEWMADYYLCTEGEVMQAAIPSNLKLSSESILIWNEERSLNFSDLNDAEFMVAEALELKKELRLSEVQQILDSAHTYPVIKRLIEKEVCFVWEELKDKYKAKTETYISLAPAYRQEEALAELLNNWGKAAPKQMELLLGFLHLQRTGGEVIQTELLKKSNATAAQLKALVDKGVLLTEKRATDRIKRLPRQIQTGFVLSAAQQTAYESIQSTFEDKTVCLLHGVTASGKTEIYARLIEEQIKAGKQVLYMLPEIALTAQIIRRLEQYFGGHIAIYHSRFNPNERVEIWNKVRTGEIQVVLGARSSLFLPFRDLGLIIADEEQDASYKQQEPAPRYNARDSAIFYASVTNAKVLLGSATPSIESYYNTEQQKYGLVTLTERYGDSQLPVIQIIDRKNTKRNNADQVFSQPLLDAMRASLDGGKQMILFQNRRGYAPYLICDSCGWIPHCKQCDVTLTLHKIRNTLNCHYCGTAYPVIHTCAACGQHHFHQKNFGTERLEEWVQEAFPDARTARMDYDSVKGKHDHDTLIKQFEQQRIDILVGTQMVVKGLDFEHVNLVGVVDADGILNFTDFRVNERAFQLLEQVSGRAGRRDDKGKVIIQVSTPQHPVLQFVQEHNFEKLYALEKANRRQFGYPPFTRLIQVVFKHREKNIAEEAAHLMMQGLKARFGDYCQGPAQPVVDRIRNQYLWEILIKLPRDGRMIQQCKKEIRQQTVIIQSNKRYRGVTIVPDTDPI